MIKTFTQNDLIRYLYRETTDKETQEISQALLQDAELNEQFTELQLATRAMDVAQSQPSSAAVLAVLSHVRSQAKRA